MDNRYIYRGKRKDNGEWVEGYIVIIGKRYFIAVTGIAEIKSDSYEVSSSNKDKNGLFTDIEGFFEVIPETVGHCTGLTDKNGKLIFEGDIVKFENHIDEIYYEEIGVCVFEQDECNFCLQYTSKNPNNYPVPKSTRTIYLISNETYKESCWYEVIGNIHDNPELLEAGKDEV